MKVFRSFEIEAIQLLAADVLSASDIRMLRDLEQPYEYDYTGGGYFLTVKHPAFAGERRVLSYPFVAGNAGEVQVGFIVFVEDGELTLECHQCGPVDVPPNIRDLEVVISTPPANYIEIISE